MYYLDPHIHMVSRITDDYETLARMGCVALSEPAFWAGFDRCSVDGFRDYFGLSPLDIEAMEVYHGLASVPPEFSPEPNDCAAIVVWTRWR